MAVWLVRAGRRGEQQNFALSNNCVVIGWDPVPDLSQYPDRESLKRSYAQLHPDAGRNFVSNHVSQLWAFAKRIQIDDIVALPLKDQDAIAFGRVVGDYEHHPSNSQGTKHTRPVEWITQDLARQYLDQDILYSLGAFLTVCQIKRNNAEARIRALLEGRAAPPIVEDNNIADAEEATDASAQPNLEEYAATQIRSYISQKFAGHALADLVEAILEAQGYQCEKSDPGPDGGVDIIAGRGPLGFDPPRLIVQVKATGSAQDINVVRELKGVMKDFSADQGLFVSWSGFKRSVWKEARRQFFEIRLWDASDMISAIQKYYGTITATDVLLWFSESQRPYQRSHAMWHIGIDLHRKTLTIAAVHDSGEVRPATKLECSDTDQIREAFEELRPFRAVIEATGTYRWLNDLLAPLGTVLLAHPMRLRAMILRRSKSDRLDAQMLAQLLQMNQIPLAYIPSERIQFIRDATRYRTTLSRQVAQAKGLLRQLLARQNMQAPYRYPFGPRGRYWFSRQDFGAIGNRMRDDLLERLEWGMRKVSEMDAQLEQIAEQYPEIEAIQDLHGVGRFTALSIVAEFGDVTRFREGRQAAAYTGLTPRVYQSGESSRGGHISKLGSPWLRWILVEAAMKLVRRDVALANFYNRIRKRSGAKKARVAAGRKLAEICWKRLYRWHRQHEVQAA